MTWPAKDRSKELAAIKRFDEGKTMSLSEEDRALIKRVDAGIAEDIERIGYTYGSVYPRTFAALLFAAREEGRQQASGRVGDLIEAARTYFDGYCQDEAAEDGPAFTGCSREQHEAAKRLGEALAALQAQGRE